MLQFPVFVCFFFLGDKSSNKSQGSLALNNGWALRCCLVVIRKDRDVFEMFVEGGALMSNDGSKEVRSVAGLLDCGELLSRRRRL